MLSGSSMDILWCTSDLISNVGGDNEITTQIRGWSSPHHRAKLSIIIIILLYSFIKLCHTAELYTHKKHIFELIYNMNSQFKSLYSILWIKLRSSFCGKE